MHRKVEPFLVTFEFLELVATAFAEVAGITFGKYTASGYVTPADIAQEAQTNEKMEIVMSNVQEKS